MGRRVRVAEYESDVLVSQQRIVWSGLAIVAVEDQDAGGQLLHRTLYGATGEIVDGTPYWYTRDHLGSIRELVDATGQVRARFDYDVYGQRTQVAGDLTTLRGFTGHWHHQQTGLVLTLFRAYDPSIGRWLSRDPIGERGGLNLYGYVGNRPTMAVDPLGLFDMLARLDCPENSNLSLSWFWTNIQRGPRPNIESFSNRRQLDSLLLKASLGGSGYHIDTLELWTHGSPQMSYLNRALTPQELADSLRPYIKKGSKIVLSACNSGNKPYPWESQGPTYAEELARLLPDAQIYGATGFVSGSMLRGDANASASLPGYPAYPGAQNGTGDGAFRRVP
jgi:RHS repeat-associated protein